MASLEESGTVAFHEMGLDDRLLKVSGSRLQSKRVIRGSVTLQAIARLGWSTPTLIQVRL